VKGAAAMIDPLALMLAIWLNRLVVQWRVNRDDSQMSVAKV
jgi:hypothetical protein